LGVRYPATLALDWSHMADNDRPLDAEQARDARYQAEYCLVEYLKSQQDPDEWVRVVDISLSESISLTAKRSTKLFESTTFNRRNEKGAYSTAQYVRLHADLRRHLRIRKTK